MRLITWNVAKRRSRLVEQATVLAEREPDIVALQEVTRRTLPVWRRAFELMGLVHVRSSIADPARAAGRRSDGVVLASRTALSALNRLPVPWSETVVGAVTWIDRARLEIYGVHVPNAANGVVKAETLASIRRGLENAAPVARVLCGDLNTPRRELPDGTVISFARDSRGRLRPDRGPEWDAAELGVVPGLKDLGYVDAYRAVNGYGRADPSWTWKTIAGHDGGWRLDHVFASPQLRPVACGYHHGWRDQGLSDHSALEADLV